LSLFRSLYNRLERFATGRKAYKWVLKDWLALHDLQTAADLVASMRHFRQISPQVLDGPSGDRILVIAPHPDDEVIGPGGTLLGAVAAGKAVEVLFLTSGRKGETATREAEAVAVAENVGFKPVFAGGTAGNIDPTAAGNAIVTAAGNAPSAIFVPFVLDDHDDHRRSSEALIHAFDTGSLSRSIEIWAYQVYSVVPGNVVVDITKFSKAKRSAIDKYASQMKSRDWGHFSLGLNAFNSRLVRARGKAVYVECFFVVPLHEYVELCRPYFAGQPPYYSRTYRH